MERRNPVVAMLAEFVGLFLFDWYSAWFWVPVIIVQIAALQLLTKAVNRERHRAFEEWKRRWDVEWAKAKRQQKASDE